MLRKNLVLAALATLLAVPAVTHAAPPDRPFELTIGAGASNSNDFDGFTGNLNGSIGYYFTDKLELSLRQSVQYTDVGAGSANGSAWNGSSRLALDLHFPLGDKGQIQPFVGANIGYVYGESVKDTWEAAPEAGVKVYLNNTTFVFVQAEYQFFFEDGGDADDAFDDGSFVYSLGLGFRF